MASVNLPRLPTWNGSFCQPVSRRLDNRLPFPGKKGRRFHSFLFRLGSLQHRTLQWEAGRAL